MLTPLESATLALETFTAAKLAEAQVPPSPVPS
jgi:hypothetical protein